MQNGRADNGGGIYNWGTLILQNSTVSGNSAHEGEAGSGGGGGIYNGGTLTVENSTVSGNSAAVGGGMFLRGGNSVVHILFTTITGNRTIIMTINWIYDKGAGGGLYVGSQLPWGQPQVQLKGVILAGNQSDSGAGVTCPPGGAILLLSLGYNLIQNITLCNFTPDSTDILGPDPLLGPLADNGGLTPTHLPQSGSPVRDRVPASACTDLKGNPITTDQRGVSRPQGSACDIGAVEQ